MTAFPFMKEFKDDLKCKDYILKIGNLMSTLEADLELIKAHDLFYSALLGHENFCMGECTDALDCCNRAAKLAFEKDTELEARCEAFAGKIHFKGLLNYEKAKRHLSNAINLSFTL